MKADQMGSSGAAEESAAAGAAGARDDSLRRELTDQTRFGLLELRGGELRLSVLPGGCVYAIERGQILINQILCSPVGGGMHRLYLRIHHNNEVRFVEIIGPRADSTLAHAPDRVVWSGQWQGLRYRCTCRVHDGGHSNVRTNVGASRQFPGEAWFWQVDVENLTDTGVTCDAVLVQDVSLATRGQVRSNEIFTSQYVDHFAARDPQAGLVLMSRQNLPQPGDTHPWLMQGCLPQAGGFATDGLDIFGASFRGGAAPVALSRPVIGESVRQGELACTAVQSSTVAVGPARAHEWTFFAHVLDDHPEASSTADLRRLQHIRAMWKEMSGAALAKPAQLTPVHAQRSILQTCELFQAEDLDDADIGRHLARERRHEESIDGGLHSFFHGDEARHVILRARELAAARPHGHIMRAGRGFAPDDELLSCTSWAAGVFAAQVTLGNTSLAKMLSTVRDPLGAIRSGGLRILVRDDPADPWRLLGVPSAFEMCADQCRWLYNRRRQLLTVSCIASEDDPALSFDIRVDGPPLELLICGEVVACEAEYETSPRLQIDQPRKRVTIRPDPRSMLARKLPGIVFNIVTATPGAVAALGGDELLFADQNARGYPYFAVRTRATDRFAFTLLGALEDTDRAEALGTKYESRPAATWRSPDQPSRFWRDITAGVRLRLPSRRRADDIPDTLAWLARDAVVHLSTPRGLEQPNGAAWGVRDVCQGPVEFLLSYDRPHLVADILRNVFSQQYLRRGDWPQWYMFPPFSEIQSSHSHGDIVIWPLKALCDYLEHTNDAAILHERLPYTDDETFERTDAADTLLEHADRLLDAMRRQLVPGLALPKYGEGDWDDALQPADRRLRERMVSSWTTALMFQTLRRYCAAMTHFGEAQRAAAAQQLADRVEAEFQQHLMPDGVVCGFAVFDGDPPTPVEYLLHPSDTRTGLRYRLIPMTRGILSGIFSREQAERHLELIREHLLFPDGARLMDRPTTYTGGIERTFRRSESAAFFGREIGLMYVHAHLRYAEALARMGRADELWHAIRAASPIAVTDAVANARPRQRNCYFTSSDAAFRDRYDAARGYDKLRRGEVPVEAGWRVYSSGPGIYTSLVIRHLFGIRRHFDSMEFDPILPRELDGAAIELDQFGRRVRYEFSLAGVGGVSRVMVNGVALSLSRLLHPYRRGGVRVPQSLFLQALTSPTSVVHIEMSAD